MLRQAQHERGGEVHRLQCHPDTPARSIAAVEVEWLANDPDEVLLTFVIVGIDSLFVPASQSAARADELWRTTCFEMFWRQAGTDAYVELNFSPSGQWAAYAFDAYRAGMRDHPMAIDPHIETFADHERLAAEIDVDFATMPPGAAQINLTAVVEEIDGTKSYWALAHPDGPPDFHDPDCFVLALPAVG